MAFDTIRDLDLELRTPVSRDENHMARPGTVRAHDRQRLELWLVARQLILRIVNHDMSGWFGWLPRVETL